MFGLKDKAVRGEGRARSESAGDFSEKSHAPYASGIAAYEERGYTWGVQPAGAAVGGGVATSSSVAVMRMLGTKSKPAPLLMSDQRTSLRKMPKTARDSTFVCIKSWIEEGGCLYEDELLLLIRTILCIPHDVQQPSTSEEAKTMFEDKYPMQMLCIHRIENKKLDDKCEESRLWHGLGNERRFVYHGTKVTALDEIAEQGFSGGMRQMWGGGIYTALDLMSALSYAMPDGFGRQFAIMCEFYEGNSKVFGARGVHGFGYDLDNKRVFTAQDPSGKMLIAAESAQVCFYIYIFS